MIKINRVFFSLFVPIDILKNHINFAIIIANSSLDLIINNIQYFKSRINDNNLVFISTSLLIKEELKKIGFDSIEFPFMVTNYKLMPKPKGNSLYFYSCDDRYGNLSFYGYYRIKNILKKYFPHLKLICGKASSVNHSNNLTDEFKNYSQSELCDIYSKCFLGIRLVNFDGLSDTVQTLEMLGIKTI